MFEILYVPHDGEVKRLGKGAPGAVKGIAKKVVRKARAEGLTVERIAPNRWEIADEGDTSLSVATVEIRPYVKK